MDNEMLIGRRLRSFTGYISLLILFLLSASLSSMATHARQAHRQEIPVVDANKWYYLVPMLIKKRAVTFRASGKWDWAILTDEADSTYSKATPVQFVPAGNGKVKIRMKRSNHGADWTYLTQGKSGVYLYKNDGASVWTWVNDDHNY